MVRAWGGWWAGTGVGGESGRHHGCTCAEPASANQGLVDQRHRCFASCHCKKWGKVLELSCRTFSVKRPELSVLCPLCVSGLGTALCAEVILGHPPPASGNTSNAMWLLHFFLFFPPGTGNTQNQLFYYYLGRGGYDFIVWGFFFLKMKNKKLYIIYILYT